MELLRYFAQRAFLVFALIFASVANVEANSTTIRLGDSGLLAAMGRIQCRGAWLSTVMDLSDIKEEELGLLKVGRQVVGPPTCKGRPTKEEELRSKQLFLGRHVTKGDLLLLKKENNDLKDQLAVKTSNLIEMTVSWQSAKKNADDLRETLLEKPKPVATLTWRIITMLLLTGFMLALAAFLTVYFLILKKEYIVTRRTEKIPNGFVERTFTLSKIRYMCTECKIEVDADHLERHVRREHAKDLYTEEDAMDRPTIAGTLITS